MTDRNPIITFTLDGTERPVDVDAITALDIAQLAPFIPYPDLITEINEGVTMLAAGALAYLAAKQAGEPVTVAAAYDQITIRSEYAVGLADTAIAVPSDGLELLERDELLALAAERGVEVGARWGVARLRAALAAAAPAPVDA